MAIKKKNANPDQGAISTGHPYRDASGGDRDGKSDQKQADKEELKTLQAEKMQQRKVSSGDVSRGLTLESGDKAEYGNSFGKGVKYNEFPIIGIGASAGGLEAVESFVSALPAKSGMAYIVITHSHPDHITRIPELLERKSKVPVVLLKDGTRLASDTIYIPPSNLDPIIENGVISLKKRQKKVELRLPIDIFLRSLAQDRGEAAGCVILSGTGTDGTLGVRKIKEKGGVAVAQDEASARHWGMPRSAIETGLVDYVLSPSQMPEQLMAYFRHPAAIPYEPQENDKQASELKKILFFLSERTRHDFSLYKKSTLIRRIQRRMSVTRSSSGSEYLRFLHKNPAEAKALFQDLLIGVTNFFRDPEVFAFLQEKVLPELIIRSRDSDSFRVWVPACSTGEEAYSVVILIKECMRELKISREMQIFATDIDPAAIKTARQGIYPANIATDVSPERLERFFVAEGDHYQVKKEIREPVVFAEQNVLRDPPFMNLDLLVCRNLLIYLEPGGQGKLIPLFHYNLKPEGVLFLGASEGTGRFTELFRPINKKFSIYQKKELNRDFHPNLQFPIGEKRPKPAKLSHKNQRTSSRADGGGIAKVVERMLLKEHTPACAIIAPNGDILYIHGRTGRYLEPTQGEANLRITDMAREGVRGPLLTALHQASVNNRQIQAKGLWAKTDGEHVKIDLTVKPVNEPSLKDCFMVLFEQVQAPSRKKSKAKEQKTAAVGGFRVNELEQDLATVRHDYNNTLRELETSNEELKSVNEEMHSSNEELQSSNEELESSKEELQSLNEELSTVNNELHRKIEEVQEAYNSITDVLNSTRIAIVFTDRDLRVKRFTAEAARLINLIDTDSGRPLEHISHNLQVDNLTEKVRQVVKSQSSFEDEVRTRNGHWYRMCIMPHRRQDALQGAVLTFIDIDAQKKAQAGLKKMNEKAVASTKRSAEATHEKSKEPGHEERSQ